MDFNLSDLQRMLLDSAERFIGEHYSLEHRRALRQTPDGLDAAAWGTFAELGWLGLAVPEAFGGLGGSMADVAVLCAALGGRCVTEPFVSSAVIAPCLIAGGEQPDAGLLEAVIAGSARVALCHDEPDERYAFDRPRRTSLNGSTLSGQKVLAVDAPSATHLIVTAQASGGQAPDGLALVLVDAAASGVSADPYRLYDGARASDIRFDAVALDAGAVIATGARAEALLADALDRARLACAAQMLGSMEAELEICSDYLKERQQFGQPIGKFQSLQHIMADMFVATHQSRSALYHALSKADADPAARARAVSLARVTIGEGSQLVSRQAIQLHGGYGVTDEYEVSHHYRRQLVLEKLYGDLDFHIGRLAA